MRRKPKKIIEQLAREREYAKEVLVVAACCWAQGLPTANDILLRAKVENYQEANRRFEEAMGGGFQ
jgi:hypothetical protein